MRLFKDSKKIFCIGHNKTGTTTIEAVFKQFGYKLGNQVRGELLLENWYNRDFKSIVKFSKTAEAFQDIPFSLPYTFQHLDEAFSEAKFILTVRDSAEQWYISLTRFHAKLWTGGERIPTLEDLKMANYRKPNYVYQANRWIYNTPESQPYDKAIMMAFYRHYNTTVIDYFRSRPHKLCIINVSNPEDYAKLCRFLNQPIHASDFPWTNKT